MSLVHVHPDKLPCDTGGTFMVVLNESLPSTEDVFSLTFKGLVSKKKISGKAVQVDTKTLMCIVGGFGDPEEVKVDVVGASGAMRIRSFKVSFVTRFQLICSLLLDNAPLQAFVVLARCLQETGKSREAMDDEISKICQRAMPADLSLDRFLGGGIMESQPTLLHFAVENGLPKFLAHMLVASPGAWEALYTTNKDCLTPRHVADKLNYHEMKTLFEDYERIALQRPVALMDYASTEGPVKTDQLKSGILADVMTKWKSSECFSNHFSSRVPNPPPNAGESSLTSVFAAANPKRKAAAKTHSAPTSHQKRTGPVYSEPSEAVRSSFIGTYELLGAPKRDSVSSKNVGRPLPAPPSTGDSTASDSEEEEEEEEDSEDETEQNAEVRDANYYKPVKSGSKVGGEKRRNSGSRQKVTQERTSIIINDEDIPDMDDDYEGSDEATGEMVDFFVINRTWQPNRPGGMLLKKGDLVTIIEQCQDQMWKVRSQKGEECIIPGAYLKRQQLSKTPKSESDPSRYSGGTPPPVTGPKPVSKLPETVPREGLYTLPGKEADKPVQDESHTSGSHTSGSSVDSGLGAIRDRLASDPERKKGIDKPPQIVEPVAERQPDTGIYDEIEERPRSKTRSGKDKIPSTSKSPESTFSPPMDRPSSPRQLHFFSRSVPQGNEEKPPFLEERQTGTSTGRPNPPIPRKPLGKYTCKWDYEAHDVSDLPLRKGDEIVVLQKHNEDWWTGMCKGKRGMFPAQYVTKLEW